MAKEASLLHICFVFFLVFQSLFVVYFSFCVISCCCGTCNSNLTAIVTKYNAEIYVKRLIIALLLFESAPQIFPSEGSILLQPSKMVDINIF